MPWQNTKSSFLLISISKQHLVKGLKSTKTTFRLHAQVHVGSLPISAVSSRTIVSNFFSSLMEPHFSPYYTGWTSMPDWHFTVKFHLPEHTSILFGSLLQTLVPQRLRACAQLYALSQKGQDSEWSQAFVFAFYRRLALDFFCMCYKLMI